MKIFSFSILLISFGFCSFLLGVSTTKDSLNKTLNQSAKTLEESLPDIFFAPLEYTRESMGTFLEFTFNHPLYGPKFFAFNLFHVSEFLKHAPKTKQPRRYCTKALQRFTSKEQSLIYINSTAFFELLEQLPEFLATYFDKTKEKEK